MQINQLPRESQLTVTLYATAVPPPGGAEEKGKQRRSMDSLGWVTMPLFNFRQWVMDEPGRLCAVPCSLGTSAREVHHFVWRSVWSHLPNLSELNDKLVMYYVSLNRDRTVNVHLNWSILSRLSFFVYYISPHSISLPRCKNIFCNLWIKAMSPKLGGVGGWDERNRFMYIILVITHTV